MIIDFHTHIFPDKLAGKVIDKLSDSAGIKYYTEATAASLCESMKLAGIDLSVVLPVVTKAPQYKTINETAKQLNDIYAESVEKLLKLRLDEAGSFHAESPALLSFGGIHPENENYREILKDLADSGIKGIKLHPLYQEKDIDDISFLRIIDCACELGLIVLIHAGRDLSFPGDHCTPAMIRHMLDEIKPRKMVLAHMGSYAYWDGVEEQLCGLGAYLDTSFSVIPIRSKASMHGDEQTAGPLAGTDGEESHSHDIPQVSANISAPLSRAQFRRIVAKNGADRILFASDSPWGDQRETFDIVNSYLDARDKDAVFFRNALNLLKS